MHSDHLLLIVKIEKERKKEIKSKSRFKVKMFAKYWLMVSMQIQIVKLDE